LLGGILCGHAQGNVYNHADWNDISMDSTYVALLKGMVYLYVSELNPGQLIYQQMNAMTVVKINLEKFIGPVLESLAAKYNPISSM
ncbi:hypothetical protein BDQ12DRAFT_616341, partial [Crucibulum laeve]